MRTYSFLKYLDDSDFRERHTSPKRHTTQTKRQTLHVTNNSSPAQGPPRTAPPIIRLLQLSRGLPQQRRHHEPYQPRLRHAADPATQRSPVYQVPRSQRGACRRGEEEWDSDAPRRRAGREMEQHVGYSLSHVLRAASKSMSVVLVLFSISYLFLKASHTNSASSSSKTLTSRKWRTIQTSRDCS